MGYIPITDQVSQIGFSLTDKKSRLDSLFLKQREIEVKKALNRAKLVLNNHFEGIKKDAQEIDLGEIQRKITLLDSHFQILKGYQPNEDCSSTKSILKKSGEKKLKRCSFSAPNSIKFIPKNDELYESLSDPLLITCHNLLKEIDDIILKQDDALTEMLLNSDAELTNLAEESNKSTKDDTAEVVSSDDYSKKSVAFGVLHPLKNEFKGDTPVSDGCEFEKDSPISASVKLLDSLNLDSLSSKVQALPSIKRSSSLPNLNSDESRKEKCVVDSSNKPSFLDRMSKPKRSYKRDIYTKKNKVKKPPWDGNVGFKPSETAPVGHSQTTKNIGIVVKKKSTKGIRNLAGSMTTTTSFPDIMHNR